MKLFIMAQDVAQDVAQDAAQDAAKDVAKDVALDVVQDLVHTSSGGAAQSASMFTICRIGKFWTLRGFLKCFSFSSLK